MLGFIPAGLLFGGLGRHLSAGQLNTRAKPVLVLRVKKGKAKPADDLDSLLDDDYDSTAISTYISCQTCFNSIMILPESLGEDGQRLNCNVCGSKFLAKVDMIERIDGEPFLFEEYRQTLEEKRAVDGN